MKLITFKVAAAFLVLSPFTCATNKSNHATTRHENVPVDTESASIVQSRIKHRPGEQSQQYPLSNTHTADNSFQFNPRHLDWLEKRYYQKRQNQVVTTLRGTQFTQEQIDQLEREINALSPSISQIEINTPRKDAFLGHCQDYILSGTVIGDDLISQLDTTNFLIKFCINAQVCEPTYTTTFEALDAKLQLSFTRFNCPFRFDGLQDKACLDELDAQGEEFGYVISPNEDMEALRVRVVEYCSWLWHFGTEFHGGTEAPTVGPSSHPSMAPTGKPSTLAPSPVPSARPTRVPTSSPSATSFPSQAPSAKPTSTGTLKPSISDVPSSHPTNAPSAYPTKSPSTVPTVFPSKSPSEQPTVLPSLLVSNRPTTYPSRIPTGNPTTSPSEKPSTIPSNPPSASPSEVPSTRPSHPPSMYPSMQPSITPSALPSDSPSREPSAIPSTQPTVYPTEGPTTIPTISPSAVPSSRPSVIPTVRPSVYPSEGPTALPTSMPSVAPSTRPSATPTVLPSAYPSEGPTTVPSTEPSSTPSTTPTATPSRVPTLFPSQVPTHSPSDSPSIAPSMKPSKSPSQHPTLFPSGQPSTVPTEEPTIAGSLSPTLTQAPSAFPTQAVPFQVDFTYITGYNETSITARSLDDAEQYVFIMDDLRFSIRKVLALEDITRRRMRSLIGFRGDDPQFSQIYHKRVIDEDSCPDSFTESVSCVRVVTEVIVYANPDTHSTDSVRKSVRSPIKESMDEGVFLNFVESSQLKEIIYLGDGAVLSNDPENFLGNDRGNLGNGGVAGIAVGSIILVTGIALFAFTRSRAEDDRSAGPNAQSSDNSSFSEMNTMTAVPVAEKRSLPVVQEKKSFEEVNVSRAAQFDTETGVVIPAVISGQSGSSSSSSNYSGSDNEGEILISRLDAAVSAGDWAAVAAIAGDLSTADEASTMSSVNTGKLSNPHERKGLTKEDAKRAAKIDKLIAEGDWNAVGIAAQAFESASSSSGSEPQKSAAVEKDVERNYTGKKRSIIDFIAGPWQSQSSAASKAIVDDVSESQIKELNISAQSDGVSSLSGGLTPDRKREIDLESGTNRIQRAMQDEEKSSESSSNQVVRPLLEPKTEKKGWKGRIPLVRRKKAEETEPAPASYALQEDSSVSSWSRGSPESQGFTPYSNDSKSKSDDVPKEMKAFGEDFGLAAAELAMRQEEEAKDIEEDEKISQKSSNSLRDELDKAIETGDWAAVEAQTNKMLDMNMDDFKLEGNSRARRNSLSSFDDSDDESRDGWSTSGKSVMSGDTEPIDDERIAMLEKLIETDDWQGIVTSSRIHNRDDLSMASSLPGESQVDGLLSLATDKEGPTTDGLDEDLSLATDVAKVG